MRCRYIQILSENGGSKFKQNINTTYQTTRRRVAEDLHLTLPWNFQVLYFNNNK
jgi:hypothetical protein